MVANSCSQAAEFALGIAGLRPEPPVRIAVALVGRPGVAVGLLRALFPRLCHGVDEAIPSEQRLVKLVAKLLAASSSTAQPAAMTQRTPTSISARATPEANSARLY